MLSECRSSIIKNLGQYSCYLEGKIMQEPVRQSLKQPYEYGFFRRKGQSLVCQNAFKTKSPSTLRLSINDDVKFKIPQLNLGVKQCSHQQFNLQVGSPSQFNYDDIKKIIRRKSCEGELFGHVNKEKTLLQSAQYQINQHRNSGLKKILKKLILQQQNAEEEHNLFIESQTLRVPQLKQKSRYANKESSCDRSNKAKRYTFTRFSLQEIAQSQGKIALGVIMNQQEIQRIKSLLGQFKQASRNASQTSQVKSMSIPNLSLHFSTPQKVKTPSNKIKINSSKKHIESEVNKTHHNSTHFRMIQITKPILTPTMKQKQISCHSHRITYPEISRLLIPNSSQSTKYAKLDNNLFSPYFSNKLKQKIQALITISASAKRNIQFSKKDIYQAEQKSEKAL